MSIATSSGQSITMMPLDRFANGGLTATTRLFWPGRFLLATSRRPGESCTCGGLLNAVA